MTENAQSIFQFRFCKRYSTLHALIAMIEKARKILDKGGTFGSLLTDLSKAFHCMTHDLLIAKLHALNFDMNALNLIFDYLTERKQRVKINSSFISHIWIYFKVSRKDQSQDRYYSIYFSVIYSYLLRKLILRVTQMITLRMCVLKILTSLQEDQKKQEQYFLNGFQTIS